MSKHIYHKILVIIAARGRSNGQNDLKFFCQNLNEFFNLFGNFKVGALNEEILARKHTRRGLVASKLIKKSEIIKLECLTFKRPAHSISSKYIDEVLDKIVKVNIPEDSILKWSMFDR